MMRSEYVADSRAATFSEIVRAPFASPVADRASASALANEGSGSASVTGIEAEALSIPVGPLPTESTSSPRAIAFVRASPLPLPEYPAVAALEERLTADVQSGKLHPTAMQRFNYRAGELLYTAAERGASDAEVERMAAELLRVGEISGRAARHVYEQSCRESR